MEHEYYSVEPTVRDYHKLEASGKNVDFKEFDTEYELKEWMLENIDKHDSHMYEAMHYLWESDEDDDTGDADWWICKTPEVCEQVNFWEWYE